jgi:Mlc titration factor MtfA (ptsG expression regulator)
LPKDWDGVHFLSAYEDFCQRVDSGEETLIDPYASDDPASSSPCCRKAFSKFPMSSTGEYPDLYDLLRRYYRQDPLARLTKATSASSTAAS